MEKRIIQLCVNAFLLLLSNTLWAQITTNELPPSLRNQNINSILSLKSDLDVISISSPDMDEIIAEDIRNDTISGFFGVSALLFRYSWMLKRMEYGVIVIMIVYAGV